MADLIYRDELKQTLLDLGFYPAIVKSALEKAQAVDADPVKHGRWLPQILLGERVWDCSECKTIGSPVWKRCPVCEAKMDGERKDNG